MIEEMTDRLLSIVGDYNLEIDADMSLHTSFRAGGVAHFLLMPQCEEKLIALLDFCTEEGLPYFILGNGTNVIFEDGGYHGAVIKIPVGEAEDITVQGLEVQANAGALLSRVTQIAADAGLSGMEALSGIPGSIGGAVKMNAGAYGSEIASVFKSARVYDTASRDVIQMCSADMHFAYRHSAVTDSKVVLSACFELISSQSELVREKMREFTSMRVAKQPLDLPSAGSFFKRPGDGMYAAALIEQSGLKGYRLGGAMVSDKHSGFIVNVDGATADEVLRLSKYVSDMVYERFHVRLEPEPVIVGGRGEINAKE